MDFSTDYDVKLIEMYQRTNNEYAVLSTYVTDISQNNQDPKNVPNLCMIKFTSTMRNWGTKECRNLQTPKLTNACWGAGLSFHKCHAELAVPVDPYLGGVFDGEEGSRGLRFFTHGYDVYTPDRVLVTHDYHNHQSNPVVHTWGRSKGKHVPPGDWPWMKQIEQERPKIRTTGTKRINLMLGVGPESTDPDDLKEIPQIQASRFGLGNKRTLEQALEFSGFNLRERKMNENKCGNLIWVPFEESTDYNLPQWMQRSLTGKDKNDNAPAPIRGGDDNTVVAQARAEAMRDLEAVESHSFVFAGLFLFISGSVVMLRKGRRKGERHRN